MTIASIYDHKWYRRCKGPVKPIGISSYNEKVAFGLHLGKLIVVVLEVESAVSSREEGKFSRQGHFISPSSAGF